MSIYVYNKFNDKFDERVNKIYGEYAKLKSKREKVHYYLCMTLNLSKKNNVNINMLKYVNKMTDYLTTKLKKKT